MEGEVNIHYRSPIRREEKEHVPEDELRKRQEDQVNVFLCPTGMIPNQCSGEHKCSPRFFSSAPPQKKIKL